MEEKGTRFDHIDLLITDDMTHQVVVTTTKVLSIQSHVVHGIVGNRAAVFPLNRLGIECDAINSVQFSNHTGYPSFGGQIIDGSELLEIIDGLDSNGLLHYSHLLTGYIGNLSLLETIASVVQRLRVANPSLIYGMLCYFQNPPPPFFCVLIVVINQEQPSSVCCCSSRSLSSTCWFLLFCVCSKKPAARFKSIIQFNHLFFYVSSPIQCCSV